MQTKRISNRAFKDLAARLSDVAQELKLCSNPTLDEFVDLLARRALDRDDFFDLIALVRLMLGIDSSTDERLAEDTKRCVPEDIKRQLPSDFFDKLLSSFREVGRHAGVAKPFN